MRVERERVGPGQASQQGPQRVDHVKERAVGAVDVVPQPLALAHAGNSFERIDRSGVGCARCRNDQEGPQSSAAIFIDLDAQGLDIHAKLVIHPNHPDAVGEDSRELGRLDDRHVRLSRGVQNAGADLGPQQRLGRKESH